MCGAKLLVSKASRTKQGNFLPKIFSRRWQENFSIIGHGSCWSCSFLIHILKGPPYPLETANPVEFLLHTYVVVRASRVAPNSYETCQWQLSLASNVAPLLSFRDLAALRNIATHWRIVFVLSFMTQSRFNKISVSLVDSAWHQHCVEILLMQTYHLCRVQMRNPLILVLPYEIHRTDCWWGYP